MIAIAAAIAPLLYVLSVGPAIAISEIFPKSEPAFRAFYIPVIWLHDHTVLRGPLESYARLWQ